VSKICLLSLLPLCCLVSPRRYHPASRRYRPAFRLILSPSSLVSGSRTHSTIYLVQHSYPAVLDSDPWSAPPRNEQVNVHTPVPFGGFGGSPVQHTLKLTVQDVRHTVPLLEPGTGGRASEDDRGRGGVDETGGNNDEDCNSWTVTDLLGETAGRSSGTGTLISNAVTVLYVHRATCPSRGGSFRRRDAVGVHCKRSPQCGDALRANGGIIWLKGTPATEDIPCLTPIGFGLSVHRQLGRSLVFIHDSRSKQSVRGRCASATVRKDIHGRQLSRSARLMAYGIDEKKHNRPGTTCMYAPRENEYT